MKYSVLICDDSMFMRSRIRDALGSTDYDIVGEAEHGLQAVQLYKELNPDAVTMDIVMPQMNGVDAVIEIVRHDPEARILMCTAIGQDSQVQEALHAGAIAYVTKPFAPPALREALQGMMS